VKRFLEQNLSPEAFQEVEQMLQGLCAQNAENQEPDDNAGFIGEFGNGPTGDQRRPRMGAQDAAGYAACGAGLRRREAQARKSYDARFPDARRIRIALDEGNVAP
jgi:hypothetical protein